LKQQVPIADGAARKRLDRAMTVLSGDRDLSRRL